MANGSQSVARSAAGYRRNSWRAALTDDRSPQNPVRKRLVKEAYIREPVSESTKSRAPKVSIIISCYNYGHFLSDSIGSALAQEGVEPEVIVVDDASTDNSAAVAQRFADADSRVAVLRRQQNGGPVMAFNDGYAEATGEFIVRLDADDMLTPGSLARAVALFDAFPSVGLVYGHPRHFTTTVPPEPRVGRARSWSIWSGVDWLAERCRRPWNVITSPEAVNRASVMKQIGPLSPKSWFAHDMEMWLRTAAVSDVGRVDGPDQALHRDHPASWSAREGHLRDIRERREVFAIFFDGPGGHLPFANELHETAKRALSAEALEEACCAYDRGRTLSVDVDSYVAFALETYAGAKDLPEWRALERRRWIGPTLAPFVPIFLARVLRRRLLHEFRYRRWTKTGV
jgi:glycosyltransferase involved in cell wall biosynthesis